METDFILLIILFWGMGLFCISVLLTAFIQEYKREKMSKKIDVQTYGYKIFLDDIRVPSYIYPNTSDEDWIIARDFEKFKKTIDTMGIPDFISFDNDLGEFDNKTAKPEGKDAVKWMVFENEFDISNMDYAVHSSNIAGPREYIISLLDNWKKELTKRNERRN